jgi:hypothetical protein
MMDHVFTRRAARALAALVLLLGGAYALPAHANDCGAEGQRACNVPERVPSCDVNLVEQAGRCVKLAQCGAEGQRPCTPVERMIFDPRTAPPLAPDALALRPQPCDLNLLTPIGPGVCARPRCGREGEAACTIVERVPSCDFNLVEKRGRCEAVACGRVGAAPCMIWERPNLSGCDVNLVLIADRCQRPGNPAPPATTSQPAPAPSGSTAPPPATAYVAPIAVTSTYTPTAAASSGSSVPSAVPGGPGSIEPGVDRMGADLYGFPLSADDPALCQTACAVNAQCAAWTYTRPGVKGPQPACFVKGSVPAPRQDPCCVSGVRGAGALAPGSTAASTTGAPASVTSPADDGMRDPQRFPRIPGLIRTQFTAATYGAEIREAASYTSTVAPQDLQQQFVARLQAEGWRRVSGSESGNSPANALLMSVWKSGTAELDLRIYGRGPGAAEVSASMSIR